MKNKKIITKADERKALEQIKKIVEGLGENSYVGTAFKGVFELAEENIEYDAAFSAEFYIKEYNTASDRERELKDEYERRLEVSNRELESMTEKLRNANEFANDQLRHNNDLLNKLEDMAKLSAQNYTASAETAQKLAKARDEIIRLKAKLYDLTVKE